MGICQLATVFQCWRILDFDSHFPGTSWGAFVSIWTLKSAGIPGCHAVLPLISKLNVLWSKTHPYSIKRRQKSFTFAWSFHGFLVCFLIFFFSLARYLCLLVEVPSKHKTFVYGATQPRNKCSYMKLGKSSKESRFSCWRVERNQISGNHKSPGSFHPGLKWSFLTPVNLCSICFQDSSEFHQTLLCPLFSGTAFTARHPHPIPHAHTHTTPTHPHT